MPTIPRIKKADAKETLLDIGLSKAAFPIKATDDYNRALVSTLVSARAASRPVRGDRYR